MPHNEDVKQSQCREKRIKPWPGLFDNLTDLAARHSGKRDGTTRIARLTFRHVGFWSTKRASERDARTSKHVADGKFLDPVSNTKPERFRFPPGST
jgi:hypothetical protein